MILRIRIHQFFLFYVVASVHTPKQWTNEKKINESASRKVCLTTSVYDIYVLFIALSKKRNNTKHNITMRNNRNGITKEFQMLLIFLVRASVHAVHLWLNSTAQMSNWRWLRRENVYISDINWRVQLDVIER